MRIRRKSDIMNEAEIELIASCSDALAHPTRVGIFRHIYLENMARRRVCNKDLVAEFGYSQATISQHVSKLAQPGLIEVRKENTFSYYFVNIGVLARYLDSVRKLNQA